MEIFIKEGDPNRLEDYAAVMRNSPLYNHYYAPNEQLLYTTLQEALSRGALLTAETSAGEAIGIMQCEWQGMFGMWPYLALLGVKDSYRGMGVGHKLIAAYEKTARALGARNIFICVSAFNPRARALYTSIGFHKLALIPDLICDGIHENLLMKRLY